MPARAVRQEEFEKLNTMLEASYNHADKDHRFIGLYAEKPLIKDYGRVYEYDPTTESGLPLDSKQFVAFFGIWPQEMQMGQAIITNGGVRSVATHPIARKKGWGQKVMADARDFMRNQNIDLSLLFTGAVGFYAKKGWRSGMMKPRFHMPKVEISKLQKATIENIIIKPENIEVRNSEQSDLQNISELYNQTNGGLYYSAHRDLGYWERHFKVRPNRFYETLVFEVEGKIIAYLVFRMGFGLHKSINLEIRELRVAPTLNKIGSPTITVVFQKLLEFVAEEALNSGDEINEMVFDMSTNNIPLRHLFQEGYKIEDRSGMDAPMILITNPYSLFKKLLPEYEARAEVGILPPGKFWMEFDQSGFYPGGLQMEIATTGFKLTITESAKEIEEWKQGNPNGISFPTISDLTIFFANILTIEDVDDDGIEDEIIISGNVAETKIWLMGLFSEFAYDLYDMDHY